jgi:hypothetical protein
MPTIRSRARRLGRPSSGRMTDDRSDLLGLAPHELTLPQAPRIDREPYRRLASRVKLLSWVSLAYMAVEGAIAVLAGILAGSVALVGFGIDSAIEGFASGIIVWRFTGARMFSEAAERRLRSWSRSSSSRWRRTSGSKPCRRWYTASART